MKNPSENRPMKIGYARVSTADQTTAAQMAALHAAGCHEIVAEKASSGKRRPQLEQLLERLPSGSKIVVWKLDRLGRSLSDLLQIIEMIKSRGADFESITEQLDTSTPAGRAMFHFVAAMAEFERDLIRERTLAGLAAARSAGRIGGRPRALTSRQIDQAMQLIDAGESVPSVARSFKVAASTMRLALKARSNDNTEKKVHHA
jgi:DNA invertase Pin-like site-specific DNA recombinase